MSEPRVTGLNHLTLSVSDLDRSFAFYVDGLGLRPLVRWARGAYLCAGEFWLCLSLDRLCRSGPLPEYSHFAFSVTPGTLATLRERARCRDWPIWQGNRSEGDSLYLQDPDGHKLELHVGDLVSRLASLRESPYDGLEWF